MKQKDFIFHHCLRKKRYKNKKAALNKLKRIKRKGWIVDSRANAYKCKFCEGWHLGHRHLDEAVAVDLANEASLIDANRTHDNVETSLLGILQRPVN